MAKQVIGHHQWNFQAILFYPSFDWLAIWSAVFFFSDLNLDNFCWKKNISAFCFFIISIYNILFFLIWLIPTLFTVSCLTLYLFQEQFVVITKNNALDGHPIYLIPLTIYKKDFYWNKHS